MWEDRVAHCARTSATPDTSENTSEEVVATRSHLTDLQSLSPQPVCVHMCARLNPASCILLMKQMVR